MGRQSERYSAQLWNGAGYRLFQLTLALPGSIHLSRSEAATIMLPNRFHSR